jgi:hypothetical protein
MTEHDFIYTLILPYVLERELAAIVFALHYANFAKSTLAYHTQESEVIEVDWQKY